MDKKIKKTPYKVKREPHNLNRYVKEKKILEKYGIINKDEYKRYIALSSRYRSFFRNTAEKNKNYPLVLKRLNRLGVLKKEQLNLNQINYNSFLERRLQTVLAKKYNLPIKKARQEIVQKKVKVNGVLKTQPGFLIRPENEEGLILNQNSKRKAKKDLGTSENKTLING